MVTLYAYPSGIVALGVDSSEHLILKEKAAMLAEFDQLSDATPVILAFTHLGANNMHHLNEALFLLDDVDAIRNAIANFRAQGK